MFQGSTLPTIQKLNAFMESAKPSVYTDGNNEGIERVMKEDGGYAFFMEAASMEYHMERNCELTQIGDKLDSKGYGVALPPGKKTDKNIIFIIISFFVKLQVLRTPRQYLTASWSCRRRGRWRCSTTGGGRRRAEGGTARY